MSIQITKDDIKELKRELKARRKLAKKVGILNAFANPIMISIGYVQLEHSGEVTAYGQHVAYVS